MRRLATRGTLATPLGEIAVVAARDGLLAVGFVDDDARLQRLLRRFHGELTVRPARDPVGACSALARWFDGDLDALGNLPRAAVGTPFQATLWAALAAIPRGTTTTYGALAASLGRPAAARAIGAANAANPLAIVVPCHRVVGADGSLTGYAGGTQRKRWLLAHERQYAGSDERS